MVKLKQHRNDIEKQEPIHCPRCNKKWDTEEKEFKMCSDEDCKYPFKQDDEFTINDYVDYNE